MRFGIIITALFLFPAVGLCQTPTADIKCNGLDTGVIVAPGSNAKIDFTIVAGSAGGTQVDIWIVMKTPFGFFSFDGSGPVAGWWFDIGHAYATGPLANDSGTVLDRSIPLGAYKAHIGIDDAANGVLNLGKIFVSDVVDFAVTGGPSNMALVPAGSFDMGDHFGVGNSDELPVHSVYIGAFYMDVYEVTNDKYCTYLNSAYAQGLIEVKNDVVYKYGDTEPYCNTYSYYPNSRIHWDGVTFTVTPQKGNHPMVVVSWYGAVAYANWKSEQEGLTPCYELNTWDCNFGAGGYRLPTEAEWEKAARGAEHNPYYQYPWGNSIDGSNANYGQSGDPYETGASPWTTPVGYYDGNQVPPGGDMANGYGLYDMAGNSWEWCNDWYEWNYYSNSMSNNPRGPSSGIYRVLRGGSWYSSAYFLRCAYRSNHSPGDRGSSFGFRLTLD